VVVICQVRVLPLWCWLHWCVPLITDQPT